MCFRDDSSLSVAATANGPQDDTITSGSVTTSTDAKVDGEEIPSPSDELQAAKRGEPSGAWQPPTLTGTSAPERGSDAPSDVTGDADTLVSGGAGFGHQTGVTHGSNCPPMATAFKGGSDTDRPVSKTDKAAARKAVDEGCGAGGPADADSLQPHTLGSKPEGHEACGSELGEARGTGGYARDTKVMTLPERGGAKLGAGVTTSVMSASRRSTSRDDTMEMDEQADSDSSHTGDSPCSSSGEAESAAGDSGNKDKQPKRPRAIRLPEDYDWRSLKPRVYGKSLPPLDPADRQTLKESIISLGFVGSRILIDEKKNIIDGNHQWMICMENGIAPAVEVIQGLTEKEKEELAYSFNRDRRQLDKEDAAEVLEARLDNLLDLREEDPKKWTQERIAAALGVSVSTVSARERFRHDSAGGTMSKPDARRKYDDDLKREAVRLVKECMPKADVARQLCMSPKAVERAVKEAEEREAGGGAAKGGKRKKAAAAKPLEAMEDISASDGVPDLYRRANKHTGQSTEIYIELVKSLAAKARKEIEAVSDIDKMRSASVLHSFGLAFASLRLTKMLQGGDRVDVGNVAAPGDSRPGRAGNEPDNILRGIVIANEPEEVFVALPVGGGGVIDKRDGCLDMYGPLEVNEVVRVRVECFDWKRALWKLQPQARQTVAPAPGAITGAHRDDRCRPNTQLAGRKAGPKETGVTK